MGLSTQPTTIFFGEILVRVCVYVRHFIRSNWTVSPFKVSLSGRKSFPFRYIQKRTSEQKYKWKWENFMSIEFEIILYPFKLNKKKWMRIKITLLFCCCFLDPIVCSLMAHFIHFVSKFFRWNRINSKWPIWNWNDAEVVRSLRKSVVYLWHVLGILWLSVCVWWTKIGHMKMFERFFFFSNSSAAISSPFFRSLQIKSTTGYYCC